MSALPPYKAYKAAGIPWLPQVPEHWEVLPNRALFTEVKEAGRPEDEMLSVTIGRGVLKQADHLASTTKKDSSRKDKSTYKRVAEGDIVYNKMRAWQGAFGISRFRGIVSPAYVVQRPTEKANSEYYHYLFRTPLFAKEAERNSYGLASDIWNLRPEHFKTILNVCPPLTEQHLIVRYLRALDAKVKRYIRIKRKLIAALQEQKQAIIQRAVTRGLDPNVKLKPSGVEWLGEVPEHWEVVRFKRLLKRIEQGVSPQAESYLAEGNAWGVLKAGCINRGVFRETEHKRLPNGYAVDRSLQVKAGDVLVSRASGSPSLVGSVGIVEEVQRQLILSDKTFRPVFHDARIKRFCVAAMNTRYFRHQVEQAISGAEGLANNLPLTSLKDFNLIVPPPEEAEFIAAHLVKETAQFDTALAALDRDIHLIQEYHTRLIADVVTGAVDVREAAGKLPVDQMIGRSDDQMMEEEPLSMAAEDAVGYGEEPEL